MPAGVASCRRVRLLERLHDRRVDATPGPQQRGRRWRWRPAAMSRFCSTAELVRRPLAVWNVRPTPSRTILCDFLPSSSCSPSLADPVAPDSPVMASTQVVLPAPFGPMRNRDPAGGARRGDAVDRDLKPVEVDVAGRVTSSEAFRVGHAVTSSSCRGSGRRRRGCVASGCRRAAVTPQLRPQRRRAHSAGTAMTTMNSRPRK